MNQIAYLGNSVSAQRQSYVGFLHEILTKQWGLDSPPRQASLGGVGSLAMSGLLDLLVLRYRPRVCFVECSLADSGGATPPSLLEIGLRTILTKLMSQGCVPVVIHLPRIDIPPEKSDQVVRNYDRLCVECGIQRIDLRSLGECGEYIDGIHTTPSFSRVIAAEIARNLEEYMPKTLPSNIHENGEVTHFIGAEESEMVTGTATPSGFRTLLPTIRVERGSVIRFAPQAGRFIGLYVIANPESGVIRIHNEDGDDLIQVWDRWCTRSRIQFISFPRGFRDEQEMSIEMTDLVRGKRNCQGDWSEELRQGTSVDVLGALFAAPFPNEQELYRAGL